MSDANAVRKLLQQAELCRDLLISNVHASLTSFRQALINTVAEYNTLVPVTQRIEMIRNDEQFRDLFRDIEDDVNDVTADVIWDMSQAIEEEEDAEEA